MRKSGDFCNDPNVYEYIFMKRLQSAVVEKE